MAHSQHVCEFLKASVCIPSDLFIRRKMSSIFPANRKICSTKNWPPITKQYINLKASVLAIISPINRELRVSGKMSRRLSRYEQAIN